LPVAQITNRTRTLVAAKKDGFTVIGLDAKAKHRIEDIPQDILSDRVLLVIGSEGSGLSRLVAETCDWLVRIPMASTTESLNAAVAASIALYAMETAQGPPTVQG
jgi:23S rRNA (guanosine2251-2'-O)-methyltransferase